MPGRPSEIAPSADWLDAMRAAAAPRVEWHQLGRLDVQIVDASQSRSGRRLLVVELDAGDEGRVLDALRGLVAPHSLSSANGS